MILKKIEFEIANKEISQAVSGRFDNDYSKRVEYIRLLGSLNEQLMKSFKGSGNTFFAALTKGVDNRMSAILAYDIKTHTEQECISIISKVIGKAKILSCREITITDFSAKLGEVDGIPTNSIIHTLGLDIYATASFFHSPAYEISEDIKDKKKYPKEKCLMEAKKIMASKSFLDEISRIYSRKNTRKYYGHPVHYYISAGSCGAAKDISDILITALLHNNRLPGGRVTTVSNITDEASKEVNFKNIFPSCRGGTVIVDLSAEYEINNYATGYLSIAKELGNQLGKYGNDILFIFVDISGSSVIRGETLTGILANGDIIEIEEGYGDYRQAVSYLRDLAQRSEFSQYADDDLQTYLPEKESYNVSDIFFAYERWYGKGLKTHIYPAYAEIDTYHIEAEKPKSRPYDKLMEMIGLDDIKKTIDRIIDSSKIQTIRHDMGLSSVVTLPHMMFYGNPGSAKTSVARLMAQILKEEGVLKSGHLVECSRSDLVGKYVGWTAQIVEDKFKSAKGGILFIDEAYSLADGSNTYGQEAINMIVQLMENYRNDVLVVFAGYPDKMKDFIRTNEGLKSRIAFHLHFKDYDPEEMVSILKLMAKEKELNLTAGALNKCRSVFEEVCCLSDFGNGRYARNLLEQAQMNQAERLFRTGEPKEITKEDVRLIKACDIESVKQMGNEPEKIKKIGFSI